MDEVGRLPRSWCYAKIDEVAAINPTLDKAGIPNDLEVSFVSMPAVQAESGTIDVSRKRKFLEVKKGYTPFRAGDVLFAKITPCMENGKMAVVPELENGIGFGSTEFHVFRTLLGVNAKYVYYYVSSQPFRREAEHNMTGAVGQKRVTTPYLVTCRIPVPPSNEQHRIVAKIEELFSELDKGIENLKTARAQLKVYRQALLKHAFEGKLTAQWRAENRDKLETADALLKRIQQERAQRYQQQLADWEARKSPSVPLLQRGKGRRRGTSTGDIAQLSILPFKKGGQGGISKPKAPKPLPPLTSEELAELPNVPEEWWWEKLGNIADLIGGVTKGKNLRGKDKISLPYLRVANVQDGYLDLSQIKEIEVEIQDEYKYQLKDGDVLYTEGGDKDKLGRGAVWHCQISQCIHQNHIFRARIYAEVLDPEILSLYSQTKSAKKYFFKHAKQTTNLASISLTVLANCPVTIIDQNEQRRILLELEARLSDVDHFDQTITTSLQQAEALRQSILKKAFSGQLVAQDPNDEPASVLLARIKAEQAAQLVVPKPRVTKKSAQST